MLSSFLYAVWSIVFFAVMLAFVEHMSLDYTQSFVIFVAGMGFGISAFCSSLRMF